MSERHTSRKPLKVSEPEMRPEYDFSGAVRGKHYKRYLEGRFRKHFDLVGTPMRIEMKTSENPFADRDR